MRGSISRLIELMPRAASFSTSVFSLNGSRKLMWIAPGFIRSTSARGGLRTWSRRSASARTSRRFCMTVAPVEAKRSSLKPLCRPVPVSIWTVAPSFTRREAVAGIIAERFSAGSVSLGTPMIILGAPGWERSSAARWSRKQEVKEEPVQANPGNWLEGVSGGISSSLTGWAAGAAKSVRAIAKAAEHSRFSHTGRNDPLAQSTQTAPKSLQLQKVLQNLSAILGEHGIGMEKDDTDGQLLVF